MGFDPEMTEGGSLWRAAASGAIKRDDLREPFRR
jgi:hypothetical protein